MMATWTQGTGDEFIAISKEGWAKGVSILHFLGGISIDLARDRAISQTKMTISQRAVVEGVEVDVLCTGRFYDFLEKRRGTWGIVLRQPIYEKDRMDPVTPGAAPALDRALFESFPVGYRHLAFADPHRLCGQEGHARPARAGCRGTLRPRSRLARRKGALADCRKVGRKGAGVCFSITVPARRRSRDAYSRP
jgi:hypothetical protein